MTRTAKRPILRQLLLCGGLSATLVLLAVPASLMAEVRMYRSTKARGVVVQQVIDQLAKAGLRFKVRRVYNEKRDGKVGFSFWLHPTRSLCDLTFYASKKPRGTLVRLFTPDSRVAARFAPAFAKARLKSLGKKPKDTGGRWPVPR